MLAEQNLVGAPRLNETSQGAEAVRPPPDAEKPERNRKRLVEQACGNYLLQKSMNKMRVGIAESQRKVQQLEGKLAERDGVEAACLEVPGGVVTIGTRPGFGINTRGDSMRAVTLSLLSLVVCLLLGASTASAEKGMSEDEKAIRAHLAAITKAYRELDPVGAMSPFIQSEKLHLFDLPPPLSVMGYAGSLKTTEDAMAAAAGPMTVDYSDITIVIDHNHAYGHYLVHFVMTMKNGKHLDMNMRTTDVYEKINGKWLIVHQHNSMPVDMATGMAVTQAPAYGPSAVPFSTTK